MSHFIVFAPAFNAEKCIERCVQSVFAQRDKYLNFELVLVDDGSEDNTYDLMCELKKHAPVPVTICRNDSNMKMPFNLATHLRGHGSLDDVVVLLDIDDFLTVPNTIFLLACAYLENPGTLLTYGSFLRWPDPYVNENQAKPYPQVVVDELGFRSFPQQFFGQPLTFKQSLFEHISDDELKDNEGNWFRAGYDRVIMYPLLELASPDRFMWIPDFLYVKDTTNPFSENVIMNTEAARVHAIIEARPKRDPLGKMI